MALPKTHPQFSRLLRTRLWSTDCGRAALQGRVRVAPHRAFRPCAEFHEISWMASSFATEIRCRNAQGYLKQKAHEVGCDMVLPRSAFSQNLPQLLHRHGRSRRRTHNSVSRCAPTWKSGPSGPRPGWHHIGPLGPVPGSMKFLGWPHPSGP